MSYIHEFHDDEYILVIRKYHDGKYENGIPYMLITRINEITGDVVSEKISRDDWWLHY
jgi:hypothetical protein